MMPRIRPYWDPVLKRDRTRRLAFFEALRKVGLLTYRLQARSFVGPDLSRCSALLHGWGQFEQRAGYERRAAVLFERAVRRSVGR